MSDDLLSLLAVFQHPLWSTEKRVFCFVSYSIWFTHATITNYRKKQQQQATTYFSSQREIERKQETEWNAIQLPSAPFGFLVWSPLWSPPGDWEVHFPVDCLWNHICDSIHIKLDVLYNHPAIEPEKWNKKKQNQLQMGISRVIFSQWSKFFAFSLLDFITDQAEYEIDVETKWQNVQLNYRNQAASSELTSEI